MPPNTSLDANNKPVSTSSFTEFAFAPGVLKTTMPRLLHSSTGYVIGTGASARDGAQTWLQLINPKFVAAQQHGVSLLNVSANVVLIGRKARQTNWSNGVVGFDVMHKKWVCCKERRR
jgi:hypothetical protein